jgi:hypothetical protein
MENKGEHTMRIRTLLMLVAALTLVATACGGTDPAAETTSTQADNGTTTTATSGETTTTAAPDETSTTAGGGSNASLASLQNSLSQTRDATKGRMEGMISITGSADLPGQTFTLPFTGAFDNEAGNFSFLMDMSFMAAQSGEVVPPEMADLLGEMEIRTIGDTSYIRFGLLAMFLGPDVEWVATSVEEGADATGGLAGTTPSNPADFLEFFEEANGTVEELGRETLRGVETTHYLVTFDMEELLANATPEERAEIESQQLPLDELPMDLWISDDGLVHKYRIEVDGTKLDVPQEEAFESMIMEFEMFDYGEDIVIEAPENFTEMENLDFGLPDL